MKALTVLLFLAAPAHAAKIVSVNVPSIDIRLGDVVSAMNAAGHNVADARCSAPPAVCYVSVPDASNVTAATLAPFFAVKTETTKRQELLDELETIEAAIDANNETASQRRRFMKIILKLYGLARRP